MDAVTLSHSAHTSSNPQARRHQTRRSPQILVSITPLLFDVEHTHEKKKSSAQAEPTSDGRHHHVRLLIETFSDGLVHGIVPSRSALPRHGGPTEASSRGTSSQSPLSAALAPRIGGGAHLAVTSRALSPTAGRASPQDSE